MEEGRARAADWQAVRGPVIPAPDLLLEQLTVKLRKLTCKLRQLRRKLRNRSSLRLSFECRTQLGIRMPQTGLARPSQTYPYALVKRESLLLP